MNMIDSRNSGDNAQLSHPDMRFIDCEYSINPINSHNIIMGHLMGKPTICIGENKDADQLRGDREADQRLCFRYSDSTIPLLLKSEISSF